MSLEYLDIFRPQTKDRGFLSLLKHVPFFPNPAFQRVTLSFSWSSRSKAQGSPLARLVSRNPGRMMLLTWVTAVVP